LNISGRYPIYVVKTMIQKGINVNNSHVLMLGITFKENCPDVRNTKIVDVIRALEEYGVNVCVYDPWANPEEVYHEYGIKPLNNINDVQNGELNNAPPSDHSSLITDHLFDAVILGVAHNEFLDLDFDALKKDVSVVYDVKGILGDGVGGKL